MLRNNKAFTLIELLVCIVIGFVLLVLVFQCCGIGYMAMTNKSDTDQVEVITQDQEAQMNNIDSNPVVKENDKL